MSRFAFIFAQSIEFRCQMDNEDVFEAAPIGFAPDISEG